MNSLNPSSTALNGPAQSLNIRTFESTQVALNGKPVKFRGQKEQALLIYLALEQTKPHHQAEGQLVRSRSHNRSSLAGLLWPDVPEAKALRYLSTSLLRLRNAIGDRGPLNNAATEDSQSANPADQTFLIVDNRSLAINPQASLEVDGIMFQKLLASIDRHNHADIHTCSQCTAKYRQVVDLYQGPFLADFGGIGDLFEGWRLACQAYYKQRVMDAFAQLSASYAAQGELERGIAITRRWVALEPSQEKAHRKLMHRLAQNGQRCAALAQYDILTQVLMDEFGIMPSPKTDALYDAIASADTVIPVSTNMHRTTKSPKAREQIVVAPSVGVHHTVRKSEPASEQNVTVWRSRVPRSALEIGSSLKTVAGDRFSVSISSTIPFIVNQATGPQ